MQASTRQRLMNAAYSAALDRWWATYKKYAYARINLRRELAQWRSSCVALGPSRRDAWPSLPQLPVFPTQLCAIDRPSFSKAIEVELLSLLPSRAV